MKLLPLIILLVGLAACSPAVKFRRDEARFNASAVKMQFKAVADMNDSYFEVRENNFFEFYRQLFDSIKNTRYPGTYSTRGDTLLLHFYDKKATALLGSKAVIRNKKEVIFFR